MGKPVRTPVETAAGIQAIFHNATVEEIGEFIADECVVREAESLPFGGEWKGPQGFADLMRAVTTTFPNFQFELDSMCTDGVEKVAFAGRISGDTPNGRFSIPIVEYWVCRDGKAVDILPVWHDTHLVMQLYNGATEPA